MFRLRLDGVEADGIDAAVAGQDDGCWADVWNESLRDYGPCGKPVAIDLGLCEHHATSVV